MSNETIFMVQAFLLMYIPLSYVFVAGILCIEGGFSFGKGLMLAFSPISAPFLAGMAFNSRG